MPGSLIGLGQASSPSTGMSTGAMVAIGVVGLAVVGGVVLHVKNRRHSNPLLLPPSPGSDRPSLPPGPPGQMPPEPPAPAAPKPKKPKRPLAFRVRLDVSPAYEAVVLFPDSTAILYRYRYPVVRFRPAKYQFSKISHGEGELFIYADQILENLVSR